MVAPSRFLLDDTLTLYPLGEESVLFSAQSRRLYGLDGTATTVFLRLRKGEEPEAVSRALGLTEDHSPMVFGLAALLAGEEAPGEDEYRTELPCSGQPPDQGKGLVRYRLLDTRFAMEGPADLVRQWILPYVAHLEAGNDGPINLLASFEAEGACWRLRLNGTPQGEALPSERLLPIFYNRLRQFAYQSRPYLLTVHGAVVAGGRSTVLLAGQSGSGKSTLAAALLAGRYRLLSDEPAVIDISGEEVLSIPLGVGLKAGSWPVVLRDFPGLESLPVHVRFDGQPMRYLLPGTIRLAPNGSRARATHLVFPSYRPNASGKLEPLSSVQALRALVGCGYHVPGLDEKRVGLILQWLTGLVCRSLAYSSTGEALALLDTALGAGDDHH